MSTSLATKDSETGRIGLSEADIRKSLKEFLATHCQKHQGMLLLDELGLHGGLHRIDLALVTDLLHGYEIKSDRDTLKRLPGQCEAFSRVFDRCTLVVTMRHLGDSREVLPDWWEVIVAKTSPATGIFFEQVREGRQNRVVSARFLAELIWYADALSMLQERGNARGLRGKPRDILWDHICQVYTLDEIRAAVRRVLRERAGAGSVQRPS